MTQAATDWTSPVPQQVADSVFRLALPLPLEGLRAVNIYAIVDGRDVTLIDAGWAGPEAVDQVDEALSRLGRSLADVGQILVTHIHRDHYTLASQLKRARGIPIALGSGERSSLERLRSGLSGAGPVPRLLGLDRAGAAHLDAARPASPVAVETVEDYEQPDRWLDDGDVVEVPGGTLKVVATPGHTLGHVVFRTESAQPLLFSGDHILPRITPSIGFEPVGNRWALRDYLASLRVVRDAADAMLLPAHGQTLPTTHARVDELLEHHRVRLDAARSAVADGAETAYAVAQSLTWTRRERTLDELRNVDQRLAVVETMAHLDVLVLDNALGVEARTDGVDVYSVG